MQRKSKIVFDFELEEGELEFHSAKIVILAHYVCSPFSDKRRDRFAHYGREYVRQGKIRFHT